MDSRTLPVLMLLSAVSIPEAVSGTEGLADFSFLLLALGATESGLRQKSKTAFAYTAVVVVALAAFSSIFGLHKAVAAGTVAAVAAGEIVARPLSDSGRVFDTMSAPAYIVVGGAAGASGALVVGADLGLSVTVGFFASLAAGTARSMEASLWLTVVVASAGALAASAVGATASAPVLVVAALGVAGLAGVANLVDVMSVSGASAGALLGYVILVTGGVGWFLVLGTFVFVGAATTAYGRDEKVEMGLEEHTEGRGFENVAANGAVALAAALVYATAPDATLETAATLGFVGCMATAAADTASSEIGSVTGEPRLITTFEHVPPGTDGGVSWQGEIVTVAAACVIGTAAYLLGVLSPSWAAIGAFAGIVGAHVDSLLGATLEGKYLGNSGVNFSACTVGAVVAGSFAYLF